MVCDTTVLGKIEQWSTEELHVCRNAGGRTSDLTSEMVKTCQGLIGIETCMHLTCTNMPKEKVDIALRVCHNSSVEPLAKLLITVALYRKPSNTDVGTYSLCVATLQWVKTNGRQRRAASSTVSI